MQHKDTKFNFLISAIADTQEIIKFIDTKAAFATIIIGGMLSLIFSDYNTLCRNYCLSPRFIKVVLWLTLTGIAISLFCLIKVIMPVNKIYCREIKPRFHLGSDKTNRVRFSPKRIEITPTIQEYQKQINAANEEDIIQSLICDLYTISYIREVKTIRLNNLLIVLISSVILFIITYILIK